MIFELTWIFSKRVASWKLSFQNCLHIFGSSMLKHKIGLDSVQTFYLGH